MISFSDSYDKLVASIAEDAGVTPEKLRIDCAMAAVAKDVIKDAPTMRVDDLK